MLSSSLPFKKRSFNLQPAPAWTAILGLAIITTLLVIVGPASRLLTYVFPIGAFAVGLFLYLKYPLLYAGFTWWIWFISPLLSRLMEYQSKLAKPGMRLIILAPYIVTMIACITFFRYFPKAAKLNGIPFVLAFMGIMYALLVGLIRNPISQIAQPLLSWLPAIFFGFHLLVNWRNYPAYRQNIQRVFTWGVIITGAYGVIQYVIAPSWDRFWLSNSPELLLSCGWPAPFQMRVWSTMNTPAIFASFMTAGLLLLFTSPTNLKIPASAAGYLAFLLSLVRAAWAAWFAGLLALMTSLKPKLQMRLMVTILILGFCVVPLTVIPPFSTAIHSRLQSFSNLQGDHSLDQRAKIYAEVLDDVVSDGWGKGMGGGKLVDVGVMDLVATLGWFGTALYMGGIGVAFVSLFRYSEARFDPFMNASRAISFSIFIMLPGTNTMILLHSMLFWGFAGMAIAGHNYYQFISRQPPMHQTIETQAISLGRNQLR